MVGTEIETQAGVRACVPPPPRPRLCCALQWGGDADLGPWLGDLLQQVLLEVELTAVGQ